MDLSSPFIPYGTAILGVALLLFKNHTLRLCGAWFIAEFLCLLLTVGINQEADASQMRIYRYLYAIAATQFLWYTTKNKSIFSFQVFKFKIEELTISFSLSVNPDNPSEALFLGRIKSSHR